MKLSKNWLLNYCDPAVDDRTFADGMTMSGSKVEGYWQEGQELSGIVVGQVQNLQRHENSDHLWVCQVDIGEKSLQIVTGAQNLREGDYVPAALDGSVIAGGKTIRNGVLRGVESAGMLCSLEELGLGVNDFPYACADGIFVLGEDCERVPGMDIHAATGLCDIVTEFEITPNRPDCLSVLGLAREAGATFDKPFTPPQVRERPDGGETAQKLKVSIDATEQCLRYAGAVVENVRIAPSPRWLRERLRASGVRSINNIVDITNYVMLEYGQPMHAFDLRFIEDGQIHVRRAQQGESITTLDGVKRSLSPEMLVIADTVKPVAVAGVMGGEYSGITADTRSIVLESACFAGAGVRRTSKKLGLRTEASSRFEKGLDPQACRVCLNRALDLIQLLDAGDIVQGIADCNPHVCTPRLLPFAPDWVNRFIGIELSAPEQQAILEKLGFRVENWQITVPSFRMDVEHAADIAEEIARFYGYENIPSRPLAGVADAQFTLKQLLERKIRECMLGCGMTEITTYSFISPKAYDKIALPQGHTLRESIVIQNPLGEDSSVMRTTALPGMLEVLARNYNNRNSAARLFEYATVYHPQNDTLPLEVQQIALGMYGDDCDFYTLEGVLEALFAAVSLKGWDIQAETENPSYHPGRCAKITLDGEEIATLGELHPQVLEQYGIGTRVYAATVAPDALLPAFCAETVYRPLPRYPATTRDLALLCDETRTVLSLQRVISEKLGEILEQIELFDVYQGAQVPEGKKSVAFTLRMRSKTGTLTDEETETAIQRALKALQAQDVQIRS